MVKLGYKLMAAEHGPAALVRNTVRAEQAGFAFAAISDYFFPWLDEQGHAPFAWSVLGAAAQATRQIQLMTAVTCPIMRYHPAIIARGGDNGSAEREPLHPRARRPFDQVGVVLRPKPRDAVVHVHFECRRCIRNGLLQPLPPFCCATQLPESSGWPAMDHREIRIRADQPFRRLNHALVFASKIKTAGNVAQMQLRPLGTDGLHDSSLEGDGFELVVPRCVVGGRLVDAIAESAASLRRATALGRDDKSRDAAQS